MHNFKGLTLSVRNLPPEFTKHDLELHFNSIGNSPEPFVGSLVKAPQSETMCATVTLSSEDACKKACAKLNGYEVWAPNGRGSYHMELDGKFDGITPLAEHEDAQFDYYFVHGLGGHAFESFAAPIQKKKHKHKDQKMWARDLLPEKFAKSGLHGRFSTLGYNANVVVGASTTTIESAAKDLLFRLQHDRPEGCRRPIFFIAHSLGGLVVAQALILALDDGDHADRLNLEGLVKGVVFMGTPFWGSFNASTISPFVTALEKVNPFPVNSGLVKSLSAYSMNLAALVSHFSQVRTQHNIDIKIFYESMPLTSGLVTRPNSAAGPLDKYCDSIPINDTHSGMVKFVSSGDPKFTNIGEFLVRLTQKHIGGPGVFRANTFSTRPPTYSSAYTPADTSAGSGSRQLGSRVNSNSPPLNSPKGTGNGWSSTSPPHANITKRSSTGSSTSTYHHNKPILPLAHRPKHPAVPFSAPAVMTIPESTSVGGRENQRNLSRLRDWDVVFVIDDTGSMDLAADSIAASKTKQRVTTRWDVLIRAMQYIADVAARYDDDGVDVYFLCSNLNMSNITDGQQILDRLQRVKLEDNNGGTYFERALSPILQAYMLKYKKYYNAVSEQSHARQEYPPKPMNIIVLTDGKADDGLQTEKLIVRVAKELDEMYAPSYQLGIQFVQVGDDVKATEYLKKLDDRLEKVHGIRDMVDTRRFVFTEEGETLGDNILNILLASMDRTLDNRDPTVDGFPEEEEEEDDPYQ